MLILLAARRLWHQRGRWALLVAGIALVIAVPVSSAGLSRSVEARAVRGAIAGLDTADRAITVSQEAASDERRGSARADDVEVRHELRRLTALPVVRELAFRPLVVSGSAVTLAGVDELSRWTRLQSGRRPASCVPSRCETLLVGGGDSPALRRAVRTIGVVVVGVAAARTAALAEGAGGESGTPLLLADGADGVARLAALELFSRHYVWTGETDAARVIALGVQTWVARSADVNAKLAGDVGSSTVEAPTDQLAAIAERADASARRLSLLGGFASVLLLGFAVVAATGLRRDGMLLNEVLRRRGATVGRTAAATAMQAVIACVAGALVGLALGGGLAAWLSSGTGHAGVWVAARAAADSSVSAALLVAATAIVTVTVLLWPQTRSRVVGRTLDLAVLVCLGAALLAGTRGSASADELASRSDPLIPALPVLSCVIAALIAARLWAPAMRLVERLLPDRSLTARIALVGALRRPLRPVATSAFLTAAIASVVFAGAYRSTLFANDADQAAYRVPLDLTVAPGLGKAAPLSVPGAAHASFVAAVTRTSASVTRLAGVVDSVPVVAAPAAALPKIARWSRVTGSGDEAATVSARLRMALPALPTLPAGTRAVAIAANGADPQTDLAIWVRAGDGPEARVGLTIHGGELLGRVPRLGAGPIEITAFGVDEGGDYATHRGHATGEGVTDQPLLSGRLTLGEVRANGAPAQWSWAGWGSSLGSVTATGATLRLGYRLDAATTVAAPNFAATQAIELPVALDPSTAADAHSGTLQLRLDSETTIRARPVAIMPRLPTVDGPFVLADRDVFQRLVDLHEPGRNPTEFWVAGTSNALDAALAGTGLSVTRRAAVQARLDADPIGGGTRTLLALVALLALAVAALALMLTVLGERRDGAGELFAWEADGVRPQTLRRVLAIRALTVASVAVPVGVAAGLLLARAGTRLVAVDASGSSPTPGLQVSLGSAWSVLALAGGVGAGLAAGWVVAALALRERHPIAPEVELR